MMRCRATHLIAFQVRRNFDHVLFATHREALPFLFP
jgi:hypothetical protein